MALTQINNEQISNASAGNVSAGIDANAKIQAGSITSTQLANNISIATTANIAVGGILTNNYYYANGAPVSFEDGYGNANVAAYLASGTDTSNITTTANISGAFILGNGSALTDISGPNVVGFVANATLATSANTSGTAATAGTVTTNAQPNITSVGTLSSLNVTGNITGSYILGNGSQLTGLPVQYTNANVKTYLDAFDGNLIPAANNVYSIGNLTNQWSSVYVSANTMYFNGVPMSGNATTLFYDNQPLVSATTDGNISTGGNVAAGNILADGYFFANGAPLTTYSDADVSAYLASGTDTADIITAGNLQGSYIVGDGSLLTNITGANVTGTVASASIAAAAYSVDGGNVFGEVAVANIVSNPVQSNITSVGVLTSLTANSATVNGQFTANGNAQFNGAAYFAGAVTIPGNITQISGNSGQFFGNVQTGFGALYAGLPAGYTLLPQEITQFSSNYDGYAQVSSHNINGGASATSDYVATADNGTDTTNYIDMGIAGSGYDGAISNNSLGTSLYPTDGYLYTKGDTVGGNLVIGSNQLGGVVRIIANGASNIGNVVGTFAANGLSVNGNVVLTGTLTGAGGSPAPSLTGFDSVNAITITASGNLVGANVTTVGNITGSYILGNGAFLTGLPAGYTDANVAAYLASGTDTQNISTTANISGAYILGNGSDLTNINGANVTGVVPAATVANTVYDNAQPNITSVGTLSSLDVTGNISGNNFNGDLAGGLSSDLSVNNFAIVGGNYNGATVLLPVGFGPIITAGYEGGVTLRASTDNTNFAVWNFNAEGNITLPSNTANINYANGVSILNSVLAEAPFTVVASNFTAVSGARYGVDTLTADGPVTATLPTTPNTGDSIFFADAGDYAANGALTIDAGTNSIMGGSSTLTVSTANQSVGLFWNGYTWRTY